MEGPATWISAIAAVASVLFAVLSAVMARRSGKARDEAQARAAEALEAIANAHRQAPLTLEVVKVDERFGPTYALRNNTDRALVVEGVDDPEGCRVKFHNRFPIALHPDAAEQVFIAVLWGNTRPSALSIRLEGDDEPRMVPVPPT